MDSPSGGLMTQLRLRVSIASFAAAVLAACGGGSQAPPPPPSTAPAGTSMAASPSTGEPAAAAAKVDPAIAAYQKTSGVSGSLSSIGSDTMNNLMTLWGEA